jgi:hypothetical protein
MDKRWVLESDGQWWLCPKNQPRRRGIAVRCQYCGNEFGVLPTVFATPDRGLYCSLPCANRAAKIRRGFRGDKHPNWRGGRHVRKRDGYVQLRVDGPDGSRQYVLEHRYVMEQELGRPLRSNETVHHKNGDKSDNRLENLELHVGRHGRGATHPHCPTCTCFST